MDCKSEPGLYENGLEEENGQVPRFDFGPHVRPRRPVKGQRILELDVS